jgi:hypothetical protein
MSKKKPTWNVVGDDGKAIKEPITIPDEVFLSFTEDENIVYGVLADRGKVHVTEIAMDTSMSVSKVRHVLNGNEGGKLADYVCGTNGTWCLKKTERKIK